ncbi:hypothetical protein EJ05DRAFT_445837 [Pseudovirgaria hyperparasitica]|uniref:DUF7924 domain-containing protein n=1 Tax=Pseudovirgaria hyperparasitica TaxID=470096 RepID=A0A6A6VT68_9PEZI|nr:uncharacterized protein EJ05DRAFT_445837 [Pseudovirgaria hyperparasitica]KAF2752954.1 hypothetical protein EJ05DRAFT_445837 [Pseudovirgaria hyperparasitica]
MSSKSSPNVSDNLAKLSAYGILVCHKATIPADVAALIKSFEEQIQGLGKNTPEKVAEVYQQAYYSKNEDEGISYLAKLLLPRGEIAHKKKGTSLITTKPELNLKETWVPITGSKTIKTYFGSLFRPKPDHAAGYVSASDAERVSVAAPFTGEEEALLNRMKLADQIHFPFFTAQWKSQGGAESHLHARVQGARDGATIINHMNKFFVAAAHNTKPVDTCHFSMTCDMDSVQLYVHWRDISSEGLERYHMELIKRTWLEEPTEVKDYKRVLRNIVHWATTTRLENIRCALVKLRNVNASRLRSTSNSPMKNMPSVTASSPSSSSSRIPPVPAPGLGTLPTFHQLSPPLSIDVGVKKRRMDEG